MQRPQFEQFVAPARASPQLWRLAGGLSLAVGIYVGLLTLLFSGLPLILGPGPAHDWLAQIARGTSPAGALILLASFSGMLLGPVIAVRLLHRRPARSLFGPRRRVLRDFAVAAGIVSAITGLSVLLWLRRFDPVPGLELGVWLGFLPLALLGVLLQTGAEEALFRGYAMQQLAARFRSPIIWMGLPSLVFGAVHYDPGSAGGNAAIVVGAAFAYGLIAADLTRVTGSLGAAWGFHFANNCYAIVILATTGTIPGLALYLTPYAASDPGVLGGVALIDVAAMVAGWAAVRLALRR